MRGEGGNCRECLFRMGCNLFGVWKGINGFFLAETFFRGLVRGFILGGRGGTMEIMFCDVILLF